MTRQSTASPSSQNCLICGDSADSLHFGALSCRYERLSSPSTMIFRACAAFFRRKVAGRRCIFRRCDRQCQVDNGMRKLCASCRFDKCLKMGMRESAVLSKLAMKNQHYKRPSQSPETDFEKLPSTSEPASLLERLQKAYRNLENAREQTYGVKKDHVPRLANYKQMNEMFMTDIKLVMENLFPLFENHTEITRDQQKLLFAHFLVPFLFLECDFKSASSELFTLPDGNYIDQNNIDAYYRNPENVNDNDGRTAVEVFRPYWKIHRQTLKANLDEVQLDLPEFLFITALIFWDFSREDQTDECIEVCQRMRSKIFEELTDYEKNVRINEDHSYRVGQIVIVLQAIQRTVNMVHETREISLIYNVYDMHSSIFEVLHLKE